MIKNDKNDKNDKTIFSKKKCPKKNFTKKSIKNYQKLIKQGQQTKVACAQLIQILPKVE